MRPSLIAAALMVSSGIAAAQEIKVAPMAPMGPIGGPIAPMAPNLPPIQQQQISPIQPNINVPQGPTSPIAQPYSGGGAPYMPRPDSHAPKCMCTELNPIDGTRTQTRCAPECCAEAGAQGC